MPDSAKKDQKTAKSNDLDTKIRLVLTGIIVVALCGWGAVGLINNGPNGFSFGCIFGGLIGGAFDLLRIRSQAKNDSSD